MAVLEVPVRRPASVAGPGPTLEVVVPVYNEEADLAPSVRRLHAYLDTRFPLGWLVTIVDNASTDRTWGIACQLADELDGVQALHLDAKGRGRALRAAWSTSRASSRAQHSTRCFTCSGPSCCRSDRGPAALSCG